MSYTLIQMLAPINPNGARPAISLEKINGVTIHMTDNWGEGADAIAHANYLKNSGSKELASWHYCIDDTHATQSIPDNEVAWHSKTYIGNYTTIAIEICVNPESDLTQACDNAALLAASLLTKYNLGMSDLYRHYDWSGKWCPSLLLDGKPYSWKKFRKKVKAAMTKGTTDIEEEDYNDKTDTSYQLIGVGSVVNFDGKSRCYSSSSGGVAGVIPPAGEYEVTHYNPGAIYSVHIGSYGWVPAANCTISDVNISNSDSLSIGSVVNFDGLNHCYATSEGMGRGVIPPAGEYIITHFNRNGRFPIHIGSYGWVSAESCKVVINPVGKIEIGKLVFFDGAVRCHSESNGGDPGIIPEAGSYKVTYYNKGAKYAVHIDSIGWVQESHCKLI